MASLSPPQKYVFRVHRIPTDDPNFLAFLAGKLATLRLNALTVALSSFGTTFVREAAYHLDDWIRLLKTDRCSFFVAVAYPAGLMEEKEMRIDAGDWVGCGTLVGPTPRKEYELPESGSLVGDDDVEEKWHMTFVYTRPEYQGNGVAKLIMKTAMAFTIDHFKSTHPSPEPGVDYHTRTRIFIHPDNVVVKKLYHDLGFVDTGRITYYEAAYANADPGMLPADEGRSDPGKYHLRTGLCMSKVQKVVW